MRCKIGFLMVLALVFGLANPANAALQSREVSYQDGKTALMGYLVWEDAFSGKRPGVLVVHEWWGLNDYAKQRAEMLARLGYVAFAADMYGAGHVTTHPSEAKGWMKKITANVGRWQKRALLALDILKKVPQVDGARMAAIGYCFGGTTVMQMAYAGAALKGVVSFLGSLPVATASQAKKIRSRILVAHGNKDPFVSGKRIIQFQAALEKAGVNWHMVRFAGAKHGFTNPGADKAGMKGVAYNQEADKRSWKAMQGFFEEVLAP